MRLIDRQDTTLAAGLIAGTIVIFQQPLRRLLDIAGEVQNRYGLDLIPALVVLSVVLVFHQYRKRQEMRVAQHAAEAQARLERTRAEELERLVAFGRSLANSLEYGALQKSLWRHLPDFLERTGLWLIVRDPNSWRVVIEESAGAAAPPHELLESAAACVLAHVAASVDGPNDEGVRVDGFLGFPVRSGETAIGVVLIRESATIDDAQRRALGAALAFLGIAVRNVQLLLETRENGLRDSLTKWFNRGYAMTSLRGELQRALRSGAALSVVMFDVDGFKELNDRQGHLAGDAALVTITEQLDRLLRGTDVKCRYGGDEFLIILPETPGTGAEQVAENLRRAIAGLAIGARAGLQVTASIGVTTARPGERNADDVIARADAAMYRAKRHGRNRVAVDGQEATTEGRLALVKRG